ncbi:LysR family transcriptional regulator [Rahnella ecdela]|uniref:LysR family transcriptional regulator n=1 Tax=Rahnella ecdela TaxID=2816250 RepID=A0ABS6LDM5_9GAMM|nr:LysR family transcriptional regulator [Rahnella ecdela]MBU9845034.1 LysR family transcriptional regulator [Rahnella ecdela]
MQDSPLLASINKIKSFDLNLLLTFEAIYLYNSVSDAANLLGKTPSAVSQSLTKLRSVFSDPLFVREGKGFVATTVAENLHLHLSEGFSQLLNSLDYFYDASTKSKFTIHSTAYAAARLMPDICAQIEKDALHCTISHISSDAIMDNDEDILIYRKADIIFDTKPFYSFSTITEPFITEHVVAVCRQDHPRLKNTLTLEEMKFENSTFLTVGSEGVKRVQNDINGYFGDREFSFSSSSIIANTAIAEKTNCVSFIPKWFATKFTKSFNIKILECEFQTEPVTLFLTYNKSSLKNNNFIEILKIINQCKELY